MSDSVMKHSTLNLRAVRTWPGHLDLSEILNYSNDKLFLI